MKILFVSTLKRKIDREETASRSQIIYRLAASLAKKGHEITLIGTKDSSIEGVNIIPVAERGWVDLPAVENPFFRETASLVSLAEDVVQIQNNFDIIHNHTYPEFILPLVENDLTIPFVTTVHVQATEDIDNALSYFKKTSFVAISNAHKKSFKKTNIQNVIYNGIDLGEFTFSQNMGEYLLWIGRLSRAKDQSGNFLDPKGVKWAISLAKETGQKLILGGAVEDMEFFEKEVKPNLNDKIQWTGKMISEQSLTRQEVANLMKDAKAFLMTINWEEPFGLVMAEAMACGTPVIAFNRGSVPEIVVDGKTGFIVDPGQGLNGLVEAVKKIDVIDRRICREHIENNFTVDKMVSAYEELYATIK